MNKTISPLGLNYAAPSAVPYRSLLTGAILSLAAIVSAQSALIDVDFNGPTGASPTYSGAALVGNAGDTWNGINAFGAGPTGTSTTPLLLSTGVASGVTLATNNSGYYFNGATFAATAYTNLMDDATFIQSGGTMTFTLTGLTVNGLYQLYFYSQGLHTNDVGSTTYSINGDTQTVNSNGSLNSFVQGSTYAVFNSEAANAAGTLVVSITGTGVAGVTGIVNGFQLSDVTPIPEPGTWLMGVALCGVGLIARRRQTVQVAA